jgi:hypothetical protein
MYCKRSAMGDRTSLRLFSFPRESVELLTRGRTPLRYNLQHYCARTAGKSFCLLSRCLWSVGVEWMLLEPLIDGVKVNLMQRESRGLRHFMTIRALTPTSQPLSTSNERSCAKQIRHGISLMQSFSRTSFLDY